MQKKVPNFTLCKITFLIYRFLFGLKHDLELFYLFIIIIILYIFFVLKAIIVIWLEISCLHPP